MSTHNLCFHGEMRRMSSLFGGKSALSVAMRIVKTLFRPCRCKEDDLGLHCSAYSLDAAHI